MRSLGAKALLSQTLFVKFRVLKQHCTKTIFYIAHKFPEKANCAVPFKYPEFVAGLGNEKQIFVYLL